jgi:hypothetical protein
VNTYDPIEIFQMRDRSVGYTVAWGRPAREGSFADALLRSRCIVLKLRISEAAARRVPTSATHPLHTPYATHSYALTFQPASKEKRLGSIQNPWPPSRLHPNPEIAD